MLLVPPSVELFGDLAFLNLIAACESLEFVDESLDGLGEADEGVDNKGRKDQPRPFYRFVI